MLRIFDPMQEVLKVAIIQSSLAWENPKANRELFSEKIDKISETVDLILLPEMFTSGFTMSPENAFETMEGDTIKWMVTIAKTKQTAIGGSLVIKEDEVFFNRFVFVSPEGIITTYDKRHTFTLAGEDKVYTAGVKKVIIDYKGWKICPLICYDLRFPVWARNAEDYDVLIYVANWPKPRVNAWDALLKARAIENMSYCIGVNRVGTDHYKHEYVGHSAVYDSLGKELCKITDSIEKTEVVILEKEHLNSTRTNLKFLDDRDRFTVE
jgi:predicted amidohydrolase